MFNLFVLALGDVAAAAGRQCLGFFRNWDHRITGIFGVAMATLNLDVVAKGVGILATVVAIACSIDRRVSQRRDEALRRTLLIAGDRRILTGVGRRVSDGGS